MNIEEIRQQLNKNLETMYQLNRKISVDETEIAQNQEEIESIDDSIEKYELEVQELKEKLADESNYRKEPSDFELKERKMIESLLAESISLEREEIFKSSQLYRKQQEQQTKMLGIYNSEIVTLRREIKDIEARLNKDEIAKKNGIAKKLHLSDEEVEALENEKNRKLELIEMGSQVMEICADEIRRYGALINENNARLNVLIEKEQRLSALISSKEKDESELDRYQMRLDKDELSKKLSALNALKNRKEFLMYDPSSEIKKQIAETEELLSNLEKSTKEVVEEKETQKELVEQNENDELEDKLFGKIDDAVDSYYEKKNAGQELQEDLSARLFKDIDKDNEIDYNENDSLVEEEKDEETQEIVPVNNIPRELVQIIDAPESLKKQKLSEKFLNLWNKWRDKAVALALAAAMTITAGIAISNMNEDDFENINSDQTASDNIDLPQSSVSDEDTFEQPTQQPNIEENVSVGVIGDFDKENTKEEPLVPENTNQEVEVPSVPEVEQTVIEQPIVPEQPKPEIEQVEQNNTPEYVAPEIPEVEIEYPVEKPVQPEMEEQTEVKLEGIVNNSEIETTVLQAEGEFVEIPLSNGEVVFVQYGDNAENVPEEITVKYVGTDMYIYSPIVNTRVL